MGRCAIYGRVRAVRLRRVDCNFLFVQSLNARKVVRYAKVLGSDNPATKHVSAVDGRERTSEFVNITTKIKEIHETSGPSATVTAGPRRTGCRDIISGSSPDVAVTS